MRTPPIEVIVADDAIERLADHAARGGCRQALVVMDANTREAAGAAVVRALRGAGVDVSELTFRQRSSLLASRDTVACVHERMRDGLGLVAVGSGVITDIVRRAADLLDQDFISVPTAASMDGYASGVTALQMDGVKVTYPARPPIGIFADPRVVAAAPAELARWGVGDMLAKATAHVDWLAAHLLYGEPYFEQTAGRVLDALARVASNVERVLAGDPAAIEELMCDLIQSGIAMAIAGSSRPASGCEHHASHLWDRLAARGLRTYAAHGLQVGYATGYAMRLQRFAFAGGVAALRPPARDPDPLGAQARKWLGDPPPAEVISAVQEKQRFIAERSTDWPRDEAAWSAVRGRLASELELFAAVQHALTLAGIPVRPGFLDVDEQALRATFRYASRLRARYTVIDFLEGQGALDQAIDAMLG